MVNNIFIIYSKVLTLGKLNSGKQQTYVKIERNDEVPMEEEKPLKSAVNPNSSYEQSILSTMSSEKDIKKKALIDISNTSKDENIIENENNNNNTSERRGNTRKNKRKVKFSSIVQYSRN